MNHDPTGAAETTDAPSPPRVSLGPVWLVLTGASAIGAYLTLGIAGQRDAGGGVYWAMLAVGTLALIAGGWLAPRTRHAVWIVVVVAALMRAVLVPLEPALSTDLHRYLWDGQVQAEGINPYVFAPEDPVLEELRDDNWQSINRKFARTIYPPVAQFAFAGAHAVGLRTASGWKALVNTVDLAAIGLLLVALGAAGRDRRRVVAYAWNPLPVMAFGLSGHVDAFVVLAVMAATVLWWRRRSWWAAAAIGLAASVKLFPLMLVVPFARERDGVWRWSTAVGVGAIATLVLAAGYLVYASAGTEVFGYLTTGYLEEEGYTDSSRFRLAQAVGLDGRWLIPPVALGVGVATLRSTRPAPTRAAWLLGAAMVLTVPFSWYATPLVALAVAGGAGWAWGYFAIALHAAYIAIFHDEVFAVLTDGARLSTPIRNLAAGAIVLLALAAVRSEWARRAVVWQPAATAAPDPAGRRTDSEERQ